MAFVLDFEFMAGFAQRKQESMHILHGFLFHQAIGNEASDSFGS